MVDQYALQDGIHTARAAAAVRMGASAAYLAQIKTIAISFADILPERRKKIVTDRLSVKEAARLMGASKWFVPVGGYAVKTSTKYTGLEGGESMKFNFEDIKLLKIVALVALAVAIAVVTIGVLAVPMVMSIVYSWCWMLLYLGYLAAGLMGLYIISRK